jgi:K+-transporting ATPase ATPase C chain
MRKNILSALRLTIFCMLFFSGFYTLIVLGIAQFTGNIGKGDIIIHNGKKYYTLIGHKFSEDKYFYSRPSAVDYNAAGAGGSNKGPTNSEYLKIVKNRIDTFKVHNPSIYASEISSDLVTASGSGIDPHISVQSANIQTKRIAKIRGLEESKIKEIINSNIEKPLLGMFGPYKLNVLKLNIALDKLQSQIIENR